MNRTDLEYKLKKLIEDLSLPLVPSEVEENMAKLSDDELQVLIDRYQILKDYYDANSNLALISDPNKFREEQEKYLDKMQHADNEYYEKLEQIEVNAADEADYEDEKAEKDIEDEVTNFENDTNLLVDTLFAIQDRVRKLVGA